LHRVALPVVSDWYQDERQLQSDSWFNGMPSRPSEPQSAVTCFYRLPTVAESAYLSLFPCWRLLNVSACCALSGVSCGVNWSPARACAVQQMLWTYLLWVDLALPCQLLIQHIRGHPELPPEREYCRCRSARMARRVALTILLRGTRRS